MPNPNPQEENKKTFPRAVYKRGSGKALDDNGRFEAQSRIVRSDEELSKLGGDWVETPAEAATSGANPSTGADAKTGVNPAADRDGDEATEIATGSTSPASETEAKRTVTTKKATK